MLVARCLLVAACLIGACSTSQNDPSGDRTGAMSTALTNGAASDAAEDPSVVALVRGTGVYCSGTLIAPRYVLTAGHCLTTPPDAVVFGSDPSTGVAVGFVAVVIHPSFDKQTLDHDVGVIELERDAAQAPARRAEVLPQSAVAGAAVRLAGFGGETAAASSGRKRRGAGLVAAVTPALFELTPGPSLSCTGDSGGPVFMQSAEAGGEVLAGVVSYGDEGCVLKAFATRVDAERSFIDGAIAPASMAPSDNGGCRFAPGSRPSSIFIEGVSLLLFALVLRRRRPVVSPTGDSLDDASPSFALQLARLGAGKGARATHLDAPDEVPFVRESQQIFASVPR